MSTKINVLPPEQEMIPARNAIEALARDILVHE
jgi:hypothetical protein